MSEMVHCNACEKEIHKTAIACPQCGAPQSTNKRYKDKTVAGLLAIFLGAFGVHRFYLGKWWGVFYLLFFWTWIPGLIALIEGIVFLCSNDEKWDDKYNDGKRFGSRSGAGVVIAIVVSVFIGIAMIGILAAVAIPAYQQYVVRARTAEALATADTAAAYVRSYVQKNQAIPATLAMTGFNANLPKSVRSIDMDQSTAEIRVIMASAPIEGKSFVLRRIVDKQSNVQWRCESKEIQPQLLPQRCR